MVKHKHFISGLMVWLGLSSGIASAGINSGNAAPSSAYAPEVAEQRLPQSSHHDERPAKQQPRCAEERRQAREQRLIEEHRAALRDFAKNATIQTILAVATPNGQR
jgi:hypothetical protein